MGRGFRCCEYPGCAFRVAPIGIMEVLANVENRVWKTVDAPRYLIGYNWTIALDVCMLLMLVVLQRFWRREQRRAQAGV